MNEQIKQLWEEAAKTTQSDSWEEQTKFMERFAELIVRECINEIAYIGKANEVFGDRTDKGGLNHILWTTETAIEKIKKHFGVE
jgi:hypothetical protein